MLCVRPSFDGKWEKEVMNKEVANQLVETSLARKFACNHRVTSDFLEAVESTGWINPMSLLVMSDNYFDHYNGRDPMRSSPKFRRTKFKS